MGIEKYFSKKPATEKKPASTPAPRKRKATDEADQTNDDDDFQPSLASKHFAKESSDKSVVDPKAFFSGSKVTAKKPAATKVSTSKLQPVIKLKSATKRKAPAKPTTIKKKQSNSDSEDDFEDDGSSSDDDDFVDDHEASHDDEDDFEEEPEEVVRPPKKSKKSDSPAPIKKPAPKKATPSKVKEEVTPSKVKEEVASSKVKEEAAADIAEAEEKPKKKNYFAMLKSQEPPKALGTRPEPVGAPNCFAGMTFVISGQYETLTKDQTKDIIMRYGGRVTSAVSGKTTYLCYGRDAGETKLAKAKTLKTKLLDEDAFYHLVESSSEKKAPPMVPPTPAKATSAAAKSKMATVPTPSKEANQTQLWTEKYKPTEVKDIIGNKELVRRINEWLENWQKNHSRGFENSGENIDDYGAILISGPPGIGKTTTATVVAKANGYEPLEFNASDVRSKKILEESITEMMDNHTMTEFFQPNVKDGAGKKAAEPRLLKGKKVVLIMDEVDGMSAGDRGGAAELAQLIRKSKIPVICICNDSRSQKVAPLLRVCFEAKFRRTPAAQIRSRILTIAFKEGLQLQPNAVDELVESTQNDIRQVINILSTYRLKEAGMNYDQAKMVGKANQKYSILGLFDIPGELITSGGWRSKTLTEKYEIYFHDYALSSLMIQENYLKSTPELAASPTGNPKERECNEMELIAKAADAIADGDLVDTMIHGTVQHWSLMPVHSIFSCVRPASYIRGQIRTKYGFPGWLGQNSKAQKFGRSLSDVQTRMRLKASGDKFEIRQNYIPTLNDRIFGQMNEDNYEGAIEMMDSYYLDRENLDVLSDLTFAPAGKHPLQQVPTKSRTAFTRAYNAKSHPILFQIGGAPIKRSVSGPREDAVGTIVEDDEPIGDDLSEEEEETTAEQDLQEIKKYMKEAPKKRKAAAASGSGRGTSKKAKSKK
ncbi:DNA replication factor C complex subunit Rfc1 [Mucor circinelloides]